jgi:hypothetical protein
MTTYTVSRSVSAPYFYRIWDDEGMPICDCGDIQAHAERVCALLNAGVAATAAQARAERAEAACEKALAFHDRYCDRVGAADGWARAVHDALRSALEADQ